MPSSSPFTPRRTSSRLPLHHHQYTKSNGSSSSHTLKRYLTKRHIIRFLLGFFCFYFFYRQFTYGSNTLSGSLKKKPRDTTFPELSIAKNIKPTPATAEKIPKIVHFIHGLRGPDPTLDLAHYIAIKAAHDVIQPEKIYLHYHYEPTGDLFEKAKPMLTMRKVPLLDQIFGQPLSHFAHRADVVRLEALRDFGGIYFDLDLFALKPIDHLLDQEFVMGEEGKGNIYIMKDEGEEYIINLFCMNIK